MARRMFSDRITSSARFLKMPATAQVLFFHLGMQADDEGVAEGFITMRVAGVSEDDLRLLEEKGFVKILNDDLVTYIEDWQENNIIRPDRFKASIYHDLLSDYLNACGQPATNCPTVDRQMSADCPPSDNQLSADCPTVDRQMSADCPHKLSKDKLSKDKTSKDKLREDSAAAKESTNSEYTGTPVDNSQQQPPLATKLASDESFGKVMAFYQDNIHPIPNQVEADDLISLYEEYGEEWLRQAIKEAARSNARSIKYIIAILKNWYSRGMPDPWNHKPPGKGKPSKEKTQDDRATEAYRGAMEILEAGGYQYGG